jgi:hypothetical protein
MFHFKIEIHVPAQGLLHGNAKGFSNTLPGAGSVPGTPFICFRLKASTRIDQRVKPADEGPYFKPQQASPAAQKDAVTRGLLLENPAGTIQAKDMALPERVIVCSQIGRIRRGPVLKKINPGCDRSNALYIIHRNIDISLLAACFSCLRAPGATIFLVHICS